MTPYSVLIIKELGNGTPKDQYETLMTMKNLLKQIAFPRRGTDEETLSLQDFANKIQKDIGREKLIDS